MNKEDLEVGGCAPLLSQNLESRGSAGGSEGACIRVCLQTEKARHRLFIYFVIYATSCLSVQ